MEPFPFSDSIHILPRWCSTIIKKLTYSDLSEIGSYYYLTCDPKFPLYSNSRSDSLLSHSREEGHPGTFQGTLSFLVPWYRPLQAPCIQAHTIAGCEAHA